MRLEEIRKARHMSRDDLAKALHVSYQTVRNYETGEREFTLSTACTICDILDCTLDELAGREAPMKSRVMTDYALLSTENKAKVSGYIAGLKDGQQ